MSTTLNLPTGIPLIELKTVGSTNDHAKTLAKNGYPDGTLVWTHEQTSGRGRHGNQWVSSSGNLFMSLVLRPHKNATLVGQLSFVTAVALAKTIEPLLPTGSKVELKWPNDLMINEKKAAGILLETELNGVAPVNWVVVGVGVNIKAAPEGATSLTAAGARADLEASDFLTSFIQNFVEIKSLWEKDLFNLIHKEYTSRSYNLGKNINIRMANETISGIYEGIDQTGALIITLNNGSKRIVTSGEVFF